MTTAPVSERLRQMRLPLVVLALVGVGVAADAAQGSGAIDVRGTFEAGACVSGTVAQCEAHDEYPQQFTIATENPETGEVTGSGVAGSDTWTVTGTISGTTLVLHDRSFTTAPGYSSDATLTVSAEGGTLQGTFSDTNGRKGAPTFAKRVSKRESATEEAARKAKEEAEKAGKRPTGTSVICNYEFATSQNTCVASVGDGGPQPPVTPTGTVTFTTTSGGFGNGASCTLRPTPLSPQVASCSLIYQTAYSGLPSITATYGGDASHAGSVGHTQFLGLGAEGTFEALTGPSGQYPNELALETEVPASGSTVEVTVQQPNPSPAPVPLTLPKIDPSLDSLSLLDLGSIGQVAQQIDVLGGQDPKTLKALGVDLGKALEHVEELMRSSNPGDQAKGQVLLDETNQTMEAITRMLKQQAEAQKQAIKNAKGSAFRAARHGAAKRPRTRSIKPLAYVVKRNVAAGKLKLKLRLSRAALAKLAGKRNSVTVLVRVDMILPSKLLKGGVPRSFVQRVTLKRAPKRHHR